MHPPPSIVDFAKLLTSISKVKHNSNVLSLSHQRDSFGFRPDVYTITIFINSFCHLHRLGFAFSVLAKMFKLGFQPHTVTFNTLMMGLYIEGKLGDAHHLNDKREILFTPHPFLFTPHIYYILIFSQIQIGVYREIDGV